MLVTLEGEAEAVIRRWADQSEAMAPARPYSVLAAFCMSRARAKEAAAAHFHQAQRLYAECQPSPPALSLLLEALGEALLPCHIFLVSCFQATAWHRADCTYGTVRKSLA